MKFSWTWLSDHLETSLSVDECVDALIRLGFEVESVVKPQFDHFIIGYISHTEPHPHADKLRICTVLDALGSSYSIVCGASNVREGLKVILALPGALIPSTQTILKKGVIRKIESQGMICSKEELGLLDHSEGIWELEENIPLETSVAKLLERDDVIIDVSITPNRGDAFSVRGLARDLTSGGFGRLRNLVFEELIVKDLCPVNVVLQTPSCSLFAGNALEKIKANPTPNWIKKRLEINNIKSIHPIVDIANFVCLDIGRPLHVYDADKIGDKLIVRQAEDNEEIEGLDGKTYRLKAEDIVISDPRSALTIAGILGGVESSVSDATTRVFIESAYFEPISIRRSGQRLGILSESRTRFERGVDSEDVVLGLRYALYLLHQTCGGDASQMLVVKPTTRKTLCGAIHFSAEAFRERTGVHLSFEQAVVYLQRLGCYFERQTPVSVRVVPPSWRHDIKITEDLIEEVLRLHGYESLPVSSLPPAYISNDHHFMDLKNIAAYLGLSEVYTWSLVSEKDASIFGGGLSIDNPLSKEMAVLRPSLLIGLLHVADLYKRRSVSAAHLFEMAHCFRESEERPMIAGLRMGSLFDLHWQKKKEFADFFTIKADVEVILQHAGLSRVQWENQAPSYYHPGRSATIRQGKSIIGYAGQIHPTLVDGAPIVAFELFTEKFISKRKKISSYTPSPYQKVVWDFSFCVPPSVSAESLISVVEKISYVQSVIIFDIYEGDAQKSVAFQVVLQSFKHTFTEEDLTHLHTEIIRAIENQFGGKLRQ